MNKCYLCDINTPRATLYFPHSFCFPLSANDFYLYFGNFMHTNILFLVKLSRLVHLLFSSILSKKGSIFEFICSFIGHGSDKLKFKEIKVILPWMTLGFVSVITMPVQWWDGYAPLKVGLLHAIKRNKRLIIINLFILNC